MVIRLTLLHYYTRNATLYHRTYSGWLIYTESTSTQNSCCGGISMAYIIVNSISVGANPPAVMNCSVQHTRKDVARQNWIVSCADGYFRLFGHEVGFWKAVYTVRLIGRKCLMTCRRHVISFLPQVGSAEYG